MTALARRSGLSLLLLLAVARVAPAQGFDAWFDARIEALIDEAAVAANGTTADRQRDAPAGDRSASLVDQSSATDFVSAAINLAAVLNPKAADGTSPPGGENTGAQSITTSLYALVAGFNGTSPTDPEFYKRHVNARRFSFTIGTAESDKEKHNTDKPATVVGAKLLLLNGRDVFTSGNQMKLAAVQKQLRDATAAGAALKARIRDMVFFHFHPNAITNGAPDPMTFATFAPQLGQATFTTLVEDLPADVRDAIDDEIRAALAPFAALRALINKTYDEIRGERQLAIAYVGNLRSGEGYNEHRFELIFDYGLRPRLTWTANGSLDYTDKSTAGSSSSGRFATEFVGDLTRPASGWGRLPIRLSGGAQFEWAEGKPTKKDAQAKLTIPVAPGVDVPLTFRYTWTPEVAEGGTGEAGGQAKVSLALDLARVLANR